jgi:hypothetical protein
MATATDVTGADDACADEKIENNGAGSAPPLSEWQVVPEEAYITRLRKQHAERYAVETVRVDLAMMRDIGALVDVDVRGVSMFISRASYDELGIPKADKRARRLTAGSKYLIPLEMVNRLRALGDKVRQKLTYDESRLALNLGGFQPYAWVPYSAWERWQATRQELWAEWEALKEQLLDDYDDYVEELKVDFTVVAREAYQAIQARDEGFAEPEGDFVARVVARALGHMPSRERIETGLVVEYRTAIVLGEAAVERDLLDRERIARQRQLEAEQALLEQARLQAARQEEASRQRKEQLWLWEEQRRAELELEGEQTRIAAMRQAEYEHAQEVLAATVSPYQEAVARVQAMLHDDAQAVLASIGTRGYLQGKSVERVEKMLSTIQAFSALKDAGLEELRAGLQAALNAPGPEGQKRDAGLVQAALEAVADATHAAAKAVERGLEPSRFDMLEV